MTVDFMVATSSKGSSHRIVSRFGATIPKNLSFRDSQHCSSDRPAHNIPRYKTDKGSQITEYNRAVAGHLIGRLDVCIAWSAPRVGVGGLCITQVLDVASHLKAGQKLSVRWRER